MAGRLTTGLCMRKAGRSLYSYNLTSHERIRHGHGFSTWRTRSAKKVGPGLPGVIATGAVLVIFLFPTDASQRFHLTTTAARTKRPPQAHRAQGARKRRDEEELPSARPPDESDVPAEKDEGAWFNFTRSFEKLSLATDIEWSKLSDKVLDFILPEWSKLVPGYVRKLQRELSMAPGSLADEIWREAHDPSINPEIEYSARVRVSDELCDDEITFLQRRRKVVTVALTRYLDMKEEIHPDDVPQIAMCGSGGGLRALVAGTGSMLATAEDGLFDCVTYTSGVSGSCWLQSLYFSSITGASLHRAIDHLKARLGVHIAYPPVAFTSVTCAPTNKYLLSGMVEKLKGNSGADFGLVDMYGVLLAARLLVPKGELGVNDKDFKLSNQREYIRFGQNPMPIYTAIRHEIPDLDINTSKDTKSVSESAKEEAKREAWFQWFEMTPFEFFCEEMAAGIPTWAIGRKFENGLDVPMSDGLYLPETRIPLLMGIFGSAFCATLSHYYREIRPLVRSISGLRAVDELISGRNEDLSKVHPIDPAMLPNFAYGMDGKLAPTAPDGMTKTEYIHLMDAGMSNNLPIYPLLRPGREVDVIIAFDASADVRADNWLSVVDGYARQRAIKGWPLGIGWPRSVDEPAETAQELERAEARSTIEAEEKVQEAKVKQASKRIEAGATPNQASERDRYEQGKKAAGELGYCTVWVGTTAERSSQQPPPPSKALDEATSWQLMEPNAGITVVYLPFLANEKVPGVNPATSDYMSTWNFVYTPEQIDNVVALARANYNEGREQIRATVRAVYERKKSKRLEREAAVGKERYRRLLRLGIADKLGEGDHFS